MAKYYLNAPLLAEVVGPTQNLTFVMAPGGGANVKHKHTGAKAGPRPAAWPESPALVSPITWGADCKAWKKADQDYTREVFKLREVYRRYNTRPHTSTYDAWMKQALPHYLRGLPCKIYPLPKVAWSLQHLVYTPATLFADHYVKDFLLPPPECQTWGLWYANIRFRNYTLYYQGTPYPACDFTLALGHNTLWPTPAAPPYVMLKLRETPPDQANPGWSDEFDPWAIRWDFTLEGSYWRFNFLALVGHYHYASIAVSDWQRQANGQPQDPLMPETARTCTVAWLDGDLAFTHWPRSWPSRRPRRSWLPAGWPPDPW